jgi:hypothetical protein
MVTSQRHDGPNLGRSLTTIEVKILAPVAASGNRLAQRSHGILDDA